MKKKQYILILLPVIAIILELLPHGAVLNFARPAMDGSIGRFRETYSYFSLMPFGYANFGPLLTAVLTCILLVMGVMYAWLKKEAFKKAIKVVAGVAVVASLMPLMFGVQYFSVVGAVITIVLVLELCCVLRMGEIEYNEYSK